MQTNVLERVRALEEDIERCIDSIVQQGLFAASVTNARHRILLDHFTVQQAELVKMTAEKLLDVYLDEDDIVEAQKAPANSKEDVAAAYKEFARKLSDILKAHRTDDDLPPIRSELNMPNPKLLNDLFTLNERFGACFDMDKHYARYSAFMVHTKTIAEACESGDVAAEMLAELAPLTPSSILRWSPLWPGRLDFFRFPKALPQILLHETEAHRKVVGFGLYKTFVKETLAYLVGFYHRVNPLNGATLERLLAEVDDGAEEYWSALLAAKDEVASVAVTAATGSGDADGDAEKEEDREGKEVGEAMSVDGARPEAAQRRKVTARIAVENKVSCGLTIPPSLRRHTKNYSIWPIAMIEKLIASTAGTRRENAVDTNDEGRGASAERHEQTAASTEASSAVGYPISLSEVKAVCIEEAKAAALLHSLLFSALENTERTMLRDYSRTMDELESDRVQAEEEFLASLAEVQKNSASTMEGTVAHAAQYNLQLSRKDSKGKATDGPNPRYGRGLSGPGVVAASAVVAAAAPQKEPETEEEELIGENGEPIPRWLAQLHQLDKVFKCDVCGGTVYKGPKVFREHFGADRHAEGLRRLGVTQHLKSFEGITSIRGVVELRDKLSASENSFRKRLRDNMDHEEIRDGRGRVLSGKAYERRQTSRR
jgi:splicing factor 3A subunit 3